LANHYCVRFLETSAKECKNVDQAFALMTREIKQNVAVTAPSRKEKDAVKPAQLSSGKSLTPKQKGGCC